MFNEDMRISSYFISKPIRIEEFRYDFVSLYMFEIVVCAYKVGVIFLGHDTSHYFLRQYIVALCEFWILDEVIFYSRVYCCCMTCPCHLNYGAHASTLAHSHNETNLNNHYDISRNLLK